MAQSEVQTVRAVDLPAWKPGMPWRKGMSGNPNGRKSGTIIGRLHELREKAKRTHTDPLDVMLYVTGELLKDAAKVKPRKWNLDGTRIEAEHEIEAAQAAAEHERRAILLQVNQVSSALAPYMHPRLQRTELAGDQDQPVRVEHATDARERLAQQLLRMAKIINGEAHEVTQHSTADASQSAQDAISEVPVLSGPITPADQTSPAGEADIAIAGMPEPERSPVRVLPNGAIAYQPSEKRPARGRRRRP